MITKIRFYKDGRMVTSKPTPFVSFEEMKAQTNNNNILDFISKLEIYESFCNSQTKTGQSKKNERRYKRRKLFENVHKNTKEKELKLFKDIQDQKIKNLEFFIVFIEYDGRKKNNLYKFIQAVEMDMNIGGISTQYYDLGLIGYTY